MASTIEQKSRRPENTAFKQQRLRAWQPILTPKTVLPTLFIIGIIFAPLGGLFLYESNRLFELVLDYTDCYDYISPYHVPNSPSMVTMSSALTSVTDQSPEYLRKSKTCKIEFQLPIRVSSPIFLYYQLTNFYQNHRRYVKSVSYRQLSGEAVSAYDLSSECDPLATDPNGQIYYPCGLIANSVFNDTIFGFKAADGKEISMNETSITWASDMKRYGETKYAVSQIVPPPNWVLRYPNGYTDQNIPSLAEDYHFQVWMRTAALPSFRKLYGRIDEPLEAQTYSLNVTLHFNTTIYDGRKYVVLSTVSYLGGKNPYLGIAYLALGSICVIFGLAFTVRHLMYPRKLGDSSYLSWNQSRHHLLARNRANHPHSTEN